MMNDLLMIPNFLDRRNEPAAPKRRVTRRKFKKLPVSNKPPKAKTFKDAFRVRVHLDDCRIGSGTHMVWAARGRTWVHLADNCGNRAKMLIRDFDKGVKV